MRENDENCMNASNRTCMGDSRTDDKGNKMY